MAGQIFKAGIRFNSPEFKYMSFVFNEDDNSCTVDATVVQPEIGEITLRGIIIASQWAGVTQDNDASQDIAASNIRTTKTTAKKTVKENK